MGKTTKTCKKTNAYVDTRNLGEDFEETKTILENVFSHVYELGELASITSSEESLNLGFKIWKMHDSKSLSELSEEEESFLGYTGMILKRKIEALQNSSENWRDFNMDIIGYMAIDEIAGSHPVNSQLLMYDIIVRKYRKTGRMVKTITAEDMAEIFYEMTGTKVPKDWFLNKKIGKRILNLRKMCIKSKNGVNIVDTIGFWENVPNGVVDKNYPIF